MGHPGLPRIRKLVWGNCCPFLATYKWARLSKLLTLTSLCKLWVPLTVTDASSPDQKNHDGTNLSWDGYENSGTGHTDSVPSTYEVEINVLDQGTE